MQYHSARRPPSPASLLHGNDRMNILRIIPLFILINPHSQPQAPQTHNHIPMDHQAHTAPQAGPSRGYNYTQYWQQQQATEYPYNGMQGVASTSTYMPASPGSMGFDYAASLRADSYMSTAAMPAQHPQAMQVNSDYSPGADPNMAWNDLVAQFNHV
jgi:hypothetical protein